MINSGDFRFRDDIEVEKTDTIPIEILTGPYKNVIMRYLKVGIKETDEDTAILQFQYALLEMGDHTETQLRKDPRFEEHLGILLNHLILETAEAEVNADRKDDPQELDEERRVYAKGSSFS